MKYVKPLIINDDRIITDEIKVKIEQNWTVGRLFRYYDKKLPFIGESIILARILIDSATYGKSYPERSIKKVISQMDEKLPIESRRWLLSKNYSNHSD